MGDPAFSHVGVCCSDLERSTRFYTEALGFRHVFTMEMGDEVAATMEQTNIRFQSRMLARGDVRVELLHWLDPQASGPTTRRPMTQLGITHLCFRVDDLESAVAKVEECGGAVHRQTFSQLDGGGAVPVRLIYVTDPDGVRVELMEGVPEL